MATRTAKSPSGASKATRNGKAMSQADPPTTLSELSKVNARLHAELVKLQAELISARNRIKILEELKPEGVGLGMSDAELEAVIRSAKPHRPARKRARGV